MISMNTPKEAKTKMGARRPRYPKDEFARRGNALYEKRVKSQVEDGNHGRIVAIDIETGEFALADDTLAASGLLFQRCPDAQPWLVRIGHKAVHRIGHYRPSSEV